MLKNLTTPNTKQVFPAVNPRAYVRGLNKIHATDNMHMIGIDTLTSPRRYYAINGTDNTIRQRDDIVGDWSTDKGFPPNTTKEETSSKLIRFKNYLYFCALDTNDSTWKIFRTEPKEADIPFDWSVVYTLTKDGANFKLGAHFNCDDQYIYIGEYGDPEETADIYRSSDGITWETVHQEPPSARHIHGINADPYKPGWVWASYGEYGHDVTLSSDDYGATWTKRLGSGGGTFGAGWASVQISFCEKYVWFADDSRNQTVFVIDKNTLTPYRVTPTWVGNIAVPGGNVGDTFYQNAFVGAISPETGVYYCVANDTSAGGNRAGLFFLPQIGASLEIYSYDVDLPFGSVLSPQVFIPGDGYVWFGNYRAKEFDVEELTQ